MQYYLDRDLVILINDVARLMRTRADQLARTQGLTRAQWVILARLEKQPGVSQSEMAALCEVEPITVARLVDRLEARGLIERRFDPHDRRMRRLYLLPSAQPVLAELHGYRDALRAAVTEGMSPAEEDALIETLIRLRSRLGCRTTEPEKHAAAE